jgi:LEA14-like dessication related protein
LNKLQGLNITDLKVLAGQGVVLDDGSNLIGNITIPNPSVMTLDLGNVTMNLAIDGTSIGYTLIPNLILVPGDNKVPMQSKVDQLKIISLIKSKYTNAIVPLEIVGNSSVANGEHLTYYEAAIKSNTIKLDLNVGPALKAIGITV